MKKTKSLSCGIYLKTRTTITFQGMVKSHEESQVRSRKWRKRVCGHSRLLWPGGNWLSLLQLERGDLWLLGGSIPDRGTRKYKILGQGCAQHVRRIARAQQGIRCRGKRRGKVYMWYSWGPDHAGPSKLGHGLWCDSSELAGFELGSDLSQCMFWKDHHGYLVETGLYSWTNLWLFA